MRHRAPRPLVLLLARLRRSAGAALGTVARQGPLRALVGVLVVLGLGTLTLGVAPSLVGGGSDAPPADETALGERSDPTVSRDGGRASRDAGDGRSPTATPSTSPSGSPSESRSGSPSESPSTAASEAPSESASARTTPDAGSVLPSETPEPTTATASPEPADTTPPETSLAADYPSGDTARFVVSADEAASFTCSLDGAAYTSCGAPSLYSDLEPGWHTFAVRATDDAGNVDPSPAEERWLATKADSGPEQG